MHNSSNQTGTHKRFTMAYIFADYSEAAVRKYGNKASDTQPPKCTAERMHIENAETGVNIRNKGGCNIHFSKRKS